VKPGIRPPTRHRSEPGSGRQFAVGLVARGAKVYAATDVTVLVNNAGILDTGVAAVGVARGCAAEMGTHYFGTLDVTRACVPIIERNGGAQSMCCGTSFS